ncbi:DinB superfamily protein [Oceanobacillus limi]|uniref:DinB superfamily protein n=1 Tax=Oceanobacillus limi TaxID=930131 RepID=A0A1H9YEW9_9BACI|nr:DinB family protein [Oceanobacillus limi]SES67534.1 DinB superfamily protein [Oceanobacillus limi]
MEVNERARNELWSEVSGISDELLNQNPVTNGWSMKQILEHLYLIETTFTKLIERQLESGKDVNVKNQPIELTVDRGYKVKAPEFAVPSDDYASLAALKEKLNTSHQALRSLFQRADPIQLQAKGIPHPAFGLLNLKQAFEFVGYHELRHIEQLKEVKEKLGLDKKNEYQE